MKEFELPEKNYAFVDGSFNPKTNVYGFGGFLIDQNGEKHIISGCGADPTMAKMRNVAGEILGASEAIARAFMIGMRVITIYYDYDGIANWPTGKWKCRNENTKKYAQFVNRSIAKGLSITFKHVKGHAGIPGNEEADLLAKSAVGIFKKKREEKCL
jgi:ribonuclease HI